MKANLYSGGLAETVSRPTPVTFSFLYHWFSGNGSLGRAMALLDLPASWSNRSTVVLDGTDLFVDLQNEEAILYGATIFRYKPQPDIHSTPQLGVAPLKLLNPVFLWNTLRILGFQIFSISVPLKVVDRAKELVQTIPATVSIRDLVELDRVITEEVWPNVIAVGILSEFFNTLVQNDAEKKGILADVLSYISYSVADNDWFFTSISHQALVRKGKMSFDEFTREYGIRADKDYELTCPRWSEIPKEIRSRIDHFDAPSGSRIRPSLQLDTQMRGLVDAAIKLHILRTEARRKALVFIAALRREIVQKVGVDSFEMLTRNQILHENGDVLRGLINATASSRVPSAAHSIPHEYVREGSGVAVSRGSIQGVVQHVRASSDTLPKNCIGVFPNASPEFSLLYPKCVGIIFLVGGQTSHGAIVAREFEIPALVAGDARDLPDGALVAIDGGQGIWRVVSE
jgi:phosphohistidine swiveling domain-containing protein